MDRFWQNLRRVAGYLASGESGGQLWRSAFQRSSAWDSVAMGRRLHDPEAHGGMPVADAWSRLEHAVGLAGSRLGTPTGEISVWS